MMPRFYMELHFCWQHQQPCSVSHFSYQEPHKIIHKHALYFSQAFVSIGYLWNFTKAWKLKRQTKVGKKKTQCPKEEMQEQNNHADN